MFYHNTKYKFALAEGSPTNIAGGIIACSAMPAGQLLRRVRKDLRKYPYLQHRLYDPQLYLSGLDPLTSRTTVAKLASHQWFAQHEVPDYDSQQHGTIKEWKDQHEDDLLATWRRSPPSGQTQRSECIRAAVAHQVELGCDAIILPSPLTNIAALNYQVEIEWLDAGIEICAEMRVSVPIFATIALADNVLRGIEPIGNPLLHTITSQIASRDELAGAYIVVEQAAEDGYVCTSRETLLSVLLLTDDLSRGAAKQVIVNYMGMFGAVMAAAGVNVWSSGYYLSQRRLKLADFEDKMGLAMPRYYSLALTGDIGLEHDVGRAFAAGLWPRVRLETPASEPLDSALAAGTFPGGAPEWEYRSSNITAAIAHYNTVAYKVGTVLDALDQPRRVDFVQRWLDRSMQLADMLNAVGIHNSTSTNMQHPAIWLSAYEGWRAYSGL